MKKFICLVLVLGMFVFVGCSKEWYAHDTVYKTNDHLAFSLCGYNDPTVEDKVVEDAQGGWWGEPIPIN